MRPRLRLVALLPLLSDMHSAVTSALGALKGPLHGGANEAVFRIMNEIERKKSDAVEHVRNMLAQKKKVPGFGHRVYHTEDPRATHLRVMSQDLGRSSGQPQWYEMSEKIEKFVKAEKKLNANVDFYSASTYHVLGIDEDLFTPVFAVSRISGWAAHVIEQLDDNRLIRPRAEYLGPQYPNHYVALDQRYEETPQCLSGGVSRSLLRALGFPRGGKRRRPSARAAASL